MTTTTCNKCAIDKPKEDFIWCDGNCRKSFHVLCSGLSRSAYASIKGNDNIKWFCDECVNVIKNLHEKLEHIWNHLVEHDQKFNERLDSIQDCVIKNIVEERKETYADKVKLVKNEPAILIKPKSDNKSGKETREDVQKRIDPSKIPVKGIRNVAKGSVVLECKNKESTEQVRKEVFEKLGNEYDISVAELRKPEIKIIGAFERPEISEVIGKLKRQNECISESAQIEVLKIDECKYKKNSHNIILKVDPQTFNNIMESGRINIGWNRCRVVENVRILRCFKCCEYGHKIGECKNSDKCGKCGDSHATKDCNNTAIKCVNCEKAKSKFNLTEINSNHSVWSADCQVFNRLLAKRKQAIGYYE
jgi:hypothetical protein